MIKDPDRQARNFVVQLVETISDERTCLSSTNYNLALLHILNDWNDAAEVVDTPSIKQLPLLTCEANGGTTTQAIPILAVWRLVQTVVKLFDDVEDGDIDSGQAEAINIAMGLLTLTQLSLMEVSDNADCLLSVFNRTVFRACYGQHDDLCIGYGQAPYPDPQTWLEIAQAKSGEFLGWAAWSGAVAAGADDSILAHYWQYGYNLGVLLQVADDFNGVWNPKDISDLATGSLSLPICYALSVTPPKAQADLRQSLERARQGDIRSEILVRQRLIDLGAQAYSLVVAQTQYHQAVAALQQANYPTSDDFGLIALLMNIMPGLKHAETPTNKTRS